MTRNSRGPIPIPKTKTVTLAVHTNREAPYSDSIPGYAKDAMLEQAVRHPPQMETMVVRILYSAPFQHGVQRYHYQTHHFLTLDMFKGDCGSSNPSQSTVQQSTLSFTDILDMVVMTLFMLDDWPRNVLYESLVPNRPPRRRRGSGN